MDIQKILAAVDHTLLRPEATWEEIRQICEDGVAFGCASVCIPPSFVKRAADCLGDKLPVCTVIGFPNGYSTTAVKALEAADAVANGAQEIDMVINTPSRGAVHNRDGYLIRRNAVECGLPCLTSLDTANAFLTCCKNVKTTQLSVVDITKVSSFLNII